MHQFDYKKAKHKQLGGKKDYECNWETSNNIKKFNGNVIELCLSVQTYVVLLSKWIQVFF
jgi:hypothetical protein